MFIKEPETFLDAFRPLIRFNFLIGMGVYRHENQTDTSYFFMKLYAFIIILINWIANYIGLISMNEILSFDNSSPMAFRMYKILVFTNAGISVSAPFLVWLRRKGTMESLQQMSILNESLRTIFGIQHEYKKDYISLISKIVAIIFVMFLVGVSDMVLSLEVKLEIASFSSVLRFISVALTLHHPILVMLLLDLNFCAFLGYLKKTYRVLNERLLGLAEKPVVCNKTKRLFVVSRKIVGPLQGNEVEGLTNDKYVLLHEIRKAHLALCKLSRKLNHSFGIQNLLSMGISFVMITGLYYTIYCAFQWKNFTLNRLKEIIPSLTWTLIYGFKIWMINHSCSVVSNESKRTGEVIYELLKPKIDSELQKEVQEFAVQMLQNPVRFNACGFFTLDYTFVQGVIGSVTTYLVILIQMGQAPLQPTSTNSFSNDTKIEQL